MRRRILVILAAVGSTALALVASCTFPDPEIVPDGAGETGTPEAANLDGAVDSNTDASIVEGTTRSDATAKVDEAGCAADPCDCDKDGFKNKGCLDGSTDAKVVDCDDFDPLRNPGQKNFVAEVPTDPLGGDWNCDGVVTRQYTTQLACNVGACAGEGFEANVPCGRDAGYFKCEALAVLCDTVANGPQRKQGCY